MGLRNLHNRPVHGSFRDEQAGLRAILSSALVAFALVSSLFTHAQSESTKNYSFANPSSWMGPSSMARGGAMVAGRGSNDSHMLNPATAVFDENYSVSGIYSAQGEMLGVSLVDTRTQPISGGVYFMQREVSKQNAQDFSRALGNYERREQRAGVTVMGRVEPQLAVGFNAKYAYRFESTAPLGSDWNLDFGAKYQMGIYAIGATIENLLKDEIGFFPRRYVLGGEMNSGVSLTWNAQVFWVGDVESGEFQYPNPEQRMGYALGGEYRPSNGISLRAGYEVNGPWGLTQATFGVGYRSKSFGVDYAMGVPTVREFGKSHQSLMVSAYF